MKRILYFTIAIWLMSIYGLSAQVDTIVTSTGELGSLGGDFEFVYETGQIVSFPRLAITGEILYYAPLVTTDSVPSATISATAATVYANIVFNGWYETVSSQGFQICADGTFTSNVQTVLVIPEQSYANCTPPCAHNSFQHTFIDLTPGSTYYVRAFATNQSGTSYGSVLSFKTLAILPTISVNTSVTDVTSSSATVSYGITSDGGAMVTGRGVCWGTDHNPSLSGNHTSDGGGIGNFYSTITGLLPNTTYYVRTYATNSVGTNYGNEVSFTTPCDVVSVTINGNTSICAGTTTTLTAPQGYVSYQWSGGQVSENTATVSQAGLYSVTVTDAYGCQYTAQVTINVIPLPEVTVSQNSTVVCQGQTMTVITITCDNGTLTHSELPQGVTFSNGALVGSPLQSGSVTFTATSGQGCGTNSKTVTITVNALPNVTVNSPAICAGQTATLIAQGASDYVWNPSAGLTITDDTHGSTATASMAGSWIVTGTDANGCSNTATANVTVNPLPNVTASASPATVCAGQSATLHAEGATSYTWSHDLGQGDDKNSGVLNTSTTFTVTGTDANGCQNFATATVTVNPLPNVTVSASPATICAGQSTVLAASGADTYSWDNSLSTGDDKQVSPTTTTTYNVTGTVTATGCTGSAQVTVTVNPLPNAPTLAVTANTLCVGHNGTVTVTASIVSGYTYSLNGEDFQAGPAFNGLEPGTYTVTVKSGEGCTSSAQATVGNNTVNPTVTATASPATICSGQSATLTASGADTYSWDNDLGTDNDIQVTPATTTTYHVTGTVTGTGCTGNGQVTVTVLIPQHGSEAVSECGSYTWHGTTYTQSGVYTFPQLDNNGCTKVDTLHLTLTPCAPTVVTTAVSDVTHNTATVTGNVTSDGGATVTERGVCWSTNPNPVISGNHSASGTGTGSYSVNLTGLTPSTTYYTRTYAVNSAGVSYGNELTFTTTAPVVTSTQPCTYDLSHPAQTGNTYRGNGFNGANYGLETVVDGKINSVTDYDGNVYPVVQIGSQCWLAENMRCTHSPSTHTYIVNNQFTSGDHMAYTYSGKMARWYNNDSLTYAPKKYGLLYNWNAAVDVYNTTYGELSINTDHSYVVNISISGNRQGICPKGWHIPSDDEWSVMEAAICDSTWQTSYETVITHRGNTAGKLVGGDDWNTDNIVQNATGEYPGNLSYSYRNVLGFEAYPAGSCTAIFLDEIGDFACFWSSTNDDVTIDYALSRVISYNYKGVGRTGYIKTSGRSVRCLRDGENSIAHNPQVTTSNANSVTLTSATLNGTVEANGNTITGQGFYYKKASGSSYTKISGALSGTSITANLTDLEPGTMYYFSAYAAANNITFVGDVVAFSTPATDAPTPTVVSSKPCTVTSSHPAQTYDRGFTSSGSNHGLEFINGDGKINSVTDYDGNEYPVVEIGSGGNRQCWLAENMRCTHSPKTGHRIVGSMMLSAGGSKLAMWYTGNVTMNSQSVNLDSASCVAHKFGLLYNWCATIDTANPSNYVEVANSPSNYNYNFWQYSSSTPQQGICPNGWHIPTDDEWNSMEAFVYTGSDDLSTAGYRGNHAGRLAGGNDWNQKNNVNYCPGNYTYGSRNSTCFYAVPAGYTIGISNNSPADAGYGAYFWSSTENDNSNAWIRHLNYSDARVNRTSAFGKDNLCSVRCLRDAEGTSKVPIVTTTEASNITLTSATLNGTVEATGSTISAQGFYYKKSFESNFTQITGTLSGTTITANLTDLDPNIEYTFYAYTIANDITYIGGEKTFITSDEVIPSVFSVAPCTIVALHPAQTGDSYRGNGFNGANHGLETVVNGELNSVTDYDGNEYPVVQIGSQCWLAENMRCTHSPKTGTYIVNKTGSGTNIDYTYTGKMARWYDNDSSTYAPKHYGLLYNWNAAMDIYNGNYGELSINKSRFESPVLVVTGNRQGICPKGWHLPSDAEWNTLEAEVAGTTWLTEYETQTGTRGSHAGKLAGGEDWTTYSGIETDHPGSPGDYTNSQRNISQFNALPSSICHSTFSMIGSFSGFWSSTQGDNYNAYRRTLYYIYSGVDRDKGSEKNSGLSIRCIRDLDESGSMVQSPTIKTSFVTGITGSTAALSAIISNPDNEPVTSKGFEWKVSTATAYSQISGTGTGDNFTAQLSDLTYGTSYTYRAFITSAGVTIYSDEKTFTTAFVCGTSTVYDHQGNEYNTVTMGDQCWTKENMRCSTSPKGYLSAGVNITSENTAYFYNYEGYNYPLEKRGLLYNWAGALDTTTTGNISESFTNRRGICPEGWHIPSLTEWNTMTSYVKGQSNFRCQSTVNNIAKALASTVSDWRSHSTTCNVGNTSSYNNATNFSAFPSGYRNNNSASNLNAITEAAYFWTSTNYNQSSVHYVYLRYNSAVVTTDDVNNKGYGMSVRCLRNPAVAPTTTTSTATNVSQTSATLNGTVTNPDNVTITAQGFLWKATDGGSFTTVNATGSTMTFNLTGLTPNTSYTYRSFVTSAKGTAYGNAIDFTTPCNVVSVTINGNTNICAGTTTTLTATQGYNSYQWSGGQVSGNTTTVSQAGTYSVTVTDAYGCQNSAQVTVTVTSCATAPTITTSSSVNGITFNSATVSGNVTSDGGATVTERGVCWSTNHNPVNTGSHSTSGSGTGSYSVNLTGLSSSTTYYVRAYAINSVGVSYGNEVGFTTKAQSVTSTAPCTVSSTHSAQTGSAYWNNGYNGANHGLETVVNGKVYSVTDYDGNEYPVVEIVSGSNRQCWLAENLRCTHSPKSGHDIVTSPMQSYGSKLAVWYTKTETMHNTSVTLNATTCVTHHFGLLYNWCAAMDTANPSNYVEVATTTSNNKTGWDYTPSSNHQGVCPKGWHIPTDAEWTTMETLVNGSAGDLAGGNDWNSINNASTAAPGNYSYLQRNSSGLSIVPAGYLNVTSLISAGDYAYIWSSSPGPNATSTNYAWYRRLTFNSPSTSTLNTLKCYGMSVRCLRN